MLALIALLAAGPASAAAPPHPWSSADGRPTAFEATLTTIARSLAGSRASLDCASPAGWRELAARDAFDPETTWGTTPLEQSDGAVRPLGRSSLAPRTCAGAAAFAARPTELGSRLCAHGTTWRWTAARAGEGATRTRKRVRTALLGECDSWASRLVAVHVVAHETMHLAGIVDEASADCLAVQLDAVVAVRLGAGATFARSLAGEYWRLYYGEQDARYRSAECRDGGSLDLFPTRTGWPTPTRYPLDLRRVVAAFAAAHPPEVTGATS